MFYHFSGGYKGSNSFARVWSNMAGAGWMGVDLFFVLSGFLITGILYDTALAENRTKNFYTRRALRIFPLFYGILFLLLLLTPVFHLHWQPGHALYFVYLGNMTGILAPGLSSIHEGLNLGHLWSLAVEEQFYMLWPFVVWKVHDRRRLLKIICVVLVLSPLLRLLLLWKGMNELTSLHPCR
jgi:peptidoglycan/LPS O-acetylase OafA/YrhL